MKNQKAAYYSLRPNFQRANKMADEVLRSMGYPKAPIPLMDIVKSNGWIVDYQELMGPDGYTYKVDLDSRNGYIIYIATDIDEKYSEYIIKCRQRFTLAHEIGHILLHGHISWDNVDEEYEAVLEVEANWLASRLLMPDYLFTHISDMDPDCLAEKCQVNYTAAQKRINSLTGKISNQLIREASKWVNLNDETLGEIKQLQMSEDEILNLNDFIESMTFDEVAVMNEDNEIECFVCGHAYWVGFSEIVPLQCTNCGADLLDLG